MSFIYIIPSPILPFQCSYSTPPKNRITYMLKIENARSDNIMEIEEKNTIGS